MATLITASRHAQPHAPSWVVREKKCEETRAKNMASLAYPLSRSLAGACLALAHFTPAAPSRPAQPCVHAPAQVHLAALQVRLGFPGAP
jgi:hypothetical protein